LNENIIEDVLEDIKKQSITNYGVINETDSNDIASFANIIGKVIDEKYNDSLLYSISEVLPLKGSIGHSFASVKENYKFIVKRKDINVKTYNINTGITKEVWDDMLNMFGKNALNSSARVLSGYSAEDENFTTMTFLDTNSELKNELIVDTSYTSWIPTAIANRVALSVLEMNKNTFKTLESFCVLDGHWASAFLAKNDIKLSDNKSSLFIGRYGSTNFYVNPFNSNTTEFNKDFDTDYEIRDPSIPTYCYVGLVSDVPSNSSLIFSPYTYETVFATDPDTGDLNIFVFNRFGLITSPLHDPLKNRGMLHKFEIKAL